MSISVAFTSMLCPSIEVEVNVSWNRMEILLEKLGFLHVGVLDHSSLNIHIKRCTNLLHITTVEQANGDAKGQTTQDIKLMSEPAMGMLTPPFLASQGLKILPVYSSTVGSEDSDPKPLCFK